MLRILIASLALLLAAPAFAQKTEILWLGQAGFRIKTPGGKVIVIDPFLTNNPKKVVGLDAYGLEIVEQVPIRVPPNPHNERYLRTKREKLGHKV